MSERWERAAFRFSRVPRRRWTSGGAPEPPVGLLPPPLVGLCLLGEVGPRWERGWGARGQVPRLRGCKCALERGGGLRWTLLLPAGSEPGGGLRSLWTPPLLALVTLEAFIWLPQRTKMPVVLD